MSNHLDTKRYIKSLAPVEALEMIERFKIPSPQAEVLKLVCVENKDLFSTMLLLERDYNLHLSKWQVGYRLAEGLAMFQRSLDKTMTTPETIPQSAASISTR